MWIDRSPGLLLTSLMAGRVDSTPLRVCGSKLLLARIRLWGWRHRKFQIARMQSSNEAELQRVNSLNNSQLLIYWCQALAAVPDWLLSYSSLTDSEQLNPGPQKSLTGPISGKWFVLFSFSEAPLHMPLRCLWLLLSTWLIDLSLAPVSSLTNFPKKQMNLKISLLGNPGKETRAGLSSLCQGLFAFFERVPGASWKSGESYGPLLRVMFFKCIKCNT